MAKDILVEREGPDRGRKGLSVVSLADAAMLVTKLHLQNFCGFKDYTIEFGQCSVLIGPNNGGKTTLLRAINLVAQCLREPVHQKAQRQGALDQLRAHRIHFEEQISAIDKLDATQPGGAHHRQQITSSWEQNQRNLENSLRPLRVNGGEVAKLFSLPSVSSLNFAHDPKNPFRVRLWFDLNGKNIEVTAAGSNGDVIEIDVILDGETLLTSLEPERISLLEAIRSAPIDFVPPIVTLMPAEQSLSWPQIQEQINQGNELRVWRNRIHWLSEGKDPELYRRVVDRIKTSLGDVRLNVPGRSQDSQPLVTLSYEEDGHTYDVAESGSGFRTLLGLAANVELSPAQILLLDEPDAHLHASVQRQVAEFLSNAGIIQKQIIISTHAPDMIEEFPLETLLWVDRSHASASPADSVTQALVNLGVASHRQAFQILDSKAILYFENKIDEKILSLLMERCGKDRLLRICSAARLKGAGDACHLSNVARFIKDHHGKAIPMVAILDADYKIPSQPAADGLVLTMNLPCKELENLLLMQPAAILAKIVKTAEQKAVDAPLTLAEIEESIDAETASDSITKQVQFNWIANRCPPTRPPDAGELRKLNDEFEALWADATFRRRFCPGKAVLRSIKKTVQDRTRLSFNDVSLFTEYEPGTEVRALFDAADAHIARTVGEQD